MLVCKFNAILLLLLKSLHPGTAGRPIITELLGILILCGNGNSIKLNLFMDGVRRGNRMEMMLIFSGTLHTVQSLIILHLL